MPHKRSLWASASVALLFALVSPQLAISARQDEQGDGDTEFPEILTTSDQIHSAYEKGRSEGWPVDFTGTLVLYDPKRTYCFVQQDDKAVYVGFPKDKWPEFDNIQPGDVIHVQGMLNDFVGGVRGSSMTVVGTGPLPDPVVQPLCELELGMHWGNWTQQEGLVKHVTRLTDATYLGLEAGGTYFSARVPEAISVEKAKSLIDSRVRISGALAAENGRGTLERFFIFTMSAGAIETITPSGEQPDYQNITLDALQRGVSGDVTFDGVISHVNRYRRVVVEQDLRSVTVHMPLTEWLYREEGVQVFGRVRNPQLVDAVLIVETRKYELPMPIRMTARQFVDQGYPMHRVIMSANVVDASSRGDLRRVHVEDDGISFFVQFETDQETYEALHLNQTARIKFQGCAIMLPSDSREDKFRQLAHRFHFLRFSQLIF